MFPLLFSQINLQKCFSQKLVNSCQKNLRYAYVNLRFRSVSCYLVEHWENLYFVFEFYSFASTLKSRTCEVSNYYENSGILMSFGHIMNWSFINLKQTYFLRKQRQTSNTIWPLVLQNVQLLWHQQMSRNVPSRSP